MRTSARSVHVKTRIPCNGQTPVGTRVSRRRTAHFSVHDYTAVAAVRLRGGSERFLRRVGAGSWPPPQPFTRSFSARLNTLADFPTMMYAPVPAGLTSAVMSRSSINARASKG